MSNRDTWKEIYERFDAERPAADHDWRVHRDQSPADDIIEELEIPMGGPRRFLLLGSIGSGKSTELLSIAEHRSKTGPVVFIDLVEHFNDRIGDPSALLHIQGWEVLLLVGLGVYRVASMFGHEWAKDDLDALDQAGQAFTSNEDNDGLSFDAMKLSSTIAVMAGGVLGSLGPIGAAAGAGLTIAGKAAEAGKWRFKMGLRDRRTWVDQDNRVQALKEAVNGLIAVIQANYATKLTIFIDGLDRINDEQAVRQLFVDSGLLGSLICATVVTGPIRLMRAGQARAVRQLRPKVLANLPVINRAHPRSWAPRTGERPGGTGIDICEVIFHRRVDDLDPHCIPPELLRKLAYYSGGRAREFIRLIRMTAEGAYLRDIPQADLELIEGVIDERRRILEMGINRKHISILNELLGDQNLPEDNEIGMMLDRGWIIPYPNESVWYYPHPMLMISKLGG